MDIMAVCIVGWSHSPFGRLDALDLEGLIGQVARGALADAGLGGADVDGVWLGQLNGGFVPEIFASSLVLQADEGLRWKPATRVENACASGAAALYAAADAIEAGRARIALVVGAEKMTSVSGAEVTRVLGNASYVPEEAAAGLTFPGIFALVAQAYFERHGDHGATLARIAAKNHANGVRNPYAHMRRDLGFDFCRTPSDKNPFVAGPLKRSDCSLVSDGAAAMVISMAPSAHATVSPVRWRSRTQVNEYLPLSRRDPTRFEGAALAWSRGLADAGMGLADLNFVETHDCFTVAELLEYEAMGLAPHGQGARVIHEGISRFEGRLPVNPSGGLKSRGHPIGATGVSQHVMAAMQLSGQAGDMQLPQANVGAVFNMGGAAVANFLSVLEAA